jgi:hypothetical protein
MSRTFLKHAGAIQSVHTNFDLAAVSPPAPVRRMEQVFTAVQSE